MIRTPADILKIQQKADGIKFKEEEEEEVKVAVLPKADKKDAMAIKQEKRTKFLHKKKVETLIKWMSKGGADTSKLRL
jgi:hypothetical protein